MMSVPEGMVCPTSAAERRDIALPRGAWERGGEVLFCGRRFAVEAVLFEFFMECVAVDAEAAGGFDLDAVAFDEHLSDHFAFDGINNAAVDVDRFLAGFVDAE